MPKGCMLSHDNLTWENTPFLRELKNFEKGFVQQDHRIVTYLPLSHIAGLAIDLISQLTIGS